MPHPGPLVTRLEAGRHAICACGKTSNAPYCDGSHARVGLAPRIVEVGPEGRPCAWCTCRASAGIPFCDGSHKRLP